MKMIMSLLLSASLLTVMSCETNQNSNDPFSSVSLLALDTFTISGMKYAVIQRVNGGVAVFNITKDSLECAELLPCPDIWPDHSRVLDYNTSWLYRGELVPFTKR